jgi:5-methylcytosine-specific restriction protein A
MPHRALTICAHPGCGRLVAHPGRCPRHQQAKSIEDAKAASGRRNAYQRGYDRRWAQARRLWLLASPLCRYCQTEGKTVAATVVDHIRPHKGDQALFWDHTNWQSLCARCHNHKTAREDGGFGNRIHNLNERTTQ